VIAGSKVALISKMFSIQLYTLHTLLAYQYTFLVH